MLKIGITGGIGSGKSTVCKVFNILGIPVFYADPEAAILMEGNPAVRKGINNIAGIDMYPDGTLNKSGLASIIFNDQVKLNAVNSLVHPFVFKNFSAWSEKQSSPYVIMEAAILIESGATAYVDKVITVVAPANERIDRVVRSKRLTREQVIERINNQTDDETRLNKSDFVINNADNEMIIPIILKIHKELTSVS
jgi:dephospho-CoA kinase